MNLQQCQIESRTLNKTKLQKYLEFSEKCSNPIKNKNVPLEGFG